MPTSDDQSILQLLRSVGTEEQDATEVLEMLGALEDTHQVKDMQLMAF